jgi:hypothetical protein
VVTLIQSPGEEQQEGGLPLPPLVDRPPPGPGHARRLAAEEVLTTERTYVRNLQTIVEVFYRPMVADGLVTEKDATQIFAGVSEIVGVNEAILAALEKRLAEGAEVLRLGDIFITFAPFLKIYTKYCNNYGTAMSVLDKVLKKQTVKDFFAAVAEDPRVGSLSITSFLIMPVQRIPRYELLLREVLKKTDPQAEAAEHANLLRALESIHDVAEHVNDAMKQAEARQKVVEVQEQLVGDLQLVTPDRVLIKMGTLGKVGHGKDGKEIVRSYVFVLFNNLMLYAERIKTDKLMCHRLIPVAEIRVSAIPDTQGEDGQRHAFRVACSEKSFDVVAGSADEQRDWINTLDRLAGEARELAEQRGTQEAAKSSADWQLDSAIAVCKVCEDKFTMTNRRHHCRKCGGVVCAPCSSHFQVIPEYGMMTPERVCDTCYFALEILDPASVEHEVHRRKVQEIEDSFAGKTTIYQPSRKFFKAGKLMKVCRKDDRLYYFFLFNDVMLYAERKAGKYHLHREVPVKGLRAEDVLELDRGIDRQALAFQIHSSAKSFVVYCSSPQEKVDWMLAITSAANYYLKEHPEAQVSFSAPVWVPDKDSKTCALCAKKFTLTFRRHHCRLCGRCVCNNCSKARVAIADLGNSSVRSCDICAEKVASGKIAGSGSGNGSGSGPSESLPPPLPQVALREGAGARNAANRKSWVVARDNEDEDDDADYKAPPPPSLAPPPSAVTVVAAPKTLAAPTPTVIVEPLPVYSDEEDDDLPAPAPPPAQALELPLGWQALTDAEGKVYYWNIVTNETSWERPQKSPEEQEIDVNDILAGDLEASNSSKARKVKEVDPTRGTRSNAKFA